MSMSVCRRDIVYVWTPMTLIRGGGFCWWIRIPTIRIISALGLSRLDTHTTKYTHIWYSIFTDFTHSVRVYIYLSRHYKRISYIFRTSASSQGGPKIGDSLGNLPMRSSAFVTVCVQPGGPSRHVETESLRASTFFARCCQSKIHQSIEKKQQHVGLIGIWEFWITWKMIQWSKFPCGHAIRLEKTDDAQEIAGGIGVALESTGMAEICTFYICWCVYG